jgi:Ala-tRNA(Pro) deacylase
MPVSDPIRNYLDSENVKYDCIPHVQAFTAQDAAHVMHVPGRTFAKPVVLTADGRLLMAVVPATHRLDLEELKFKLGVDSLELVPEGALGKFCPECELGALPPLGQLYGMDVWVDKSLEGSEEIVFNAGTHTEAIRMKYADFVRITLPHLARFADRAAA